MKVKECKLGPSITCECTDTVSQICKKFKEAEHGHVVVVENNAPIGIICAHDIVCDVIGENKDINTTKAEDIMTSPVFVVTDEAEVPVVVAAFIKKGLHCSPVVNDKDECIGTVSMKELVTQLNKNES